MQLIQAKLTLTVTVTVTVKAYSRIRPNTPQHQKPEFHVLLTVHLGSILVNNQHEAQFFLYICSNSLHVSSTTVLIIRRINFINTISGICHSMQVTVQCAGLDGTDNFHSNLHTRRSPTQLAYTRCRINTIDSSDDEHNGVRNMQRIGINIYANEMCVELLIYKN